MNRVVVCLLLITGCASYEKTRRAVDEEIAKTPWFTETEEAFILMKGCLKLEEKSEGRHYCLANFLNRSYTHDDDNFPLASGEEVENEYNKSGTNAIVACVQKNIEVQLPQDALVAMCLTKTIEGWARDSHALRVADRRWADEVRESQIRAAQWQAVSNALGGLANTMHRIDTDNRLRRIENQNNQIQYEQTYQRQMLQNR